MENREIKEMQALPIVLDGLDEKSGKASSPHVKDDPGHEARRRQLRSSARGSSSAC